MEVVRLSAVHAQMFVGISLAFGAAAADSSMEASASSTVRFECAAESTIYVHALPCALLIALVSVFIINGAFIVKLRRKHYQDELGMLSISNDEFIRNLGMNVEQMLPEFCAGPNLSSCAVCLLPLESGDLIRRLQCGHGFHGTCILSWWRHKHRRIHELDCPLCRRIQDL